MNLKCAKKSRFHLQFPLLLFYLFVIFMVVPTLIFKSIEYGFYREFHQRKVIGGVCTVFTLPVSLLLIIQHFLFCSKPEEQIYLVRILWVVPICTLTAWFNVICLEKRLVNSFRECYEAFAIYSFTNLLFDHLKKNVGNMEKMMECKIQNQHVPLTLTSDFNKKCKYGIYQCCAVKVATSLVVFYDTQSRNRGFEKTFIITFISYSIALYCLNLFYQATKEELASLKPKRKLFALIAVVFFPFFQLMIIKLIVGKGILQTFWRMDFSYFHDDFYTCDTSENVHNFMLCFEMFFVAVICHHCFSIHLYAQNLSECRSWKDIKTIFFSASDDNFQHVDTEPESSECIKPQLVEKIEENIEKEKNELDALENYIIYEPSKKNLE